MVHVFDMCRTAACRCCRNRQNVNENSYEKWEKEKAMSAKSWMESKRYVSERSSRGAGKRAERNFCQQHVRCAFGWICVREWNASCRYFALFCAENRRRHLDEFFSFYICRFFPLAFSMWLRHNEIWWAKEKAQKKRKIHFQQREVAGNQFQAFFYVCVSIDSRCEFMRMMAHLLRMCILY